jgi:DNA primase
MKKRFSSHELFELRNAIPVRWLIRDELQIPSKISEGVFRFLCPVCNEFQTSTHPTTNLARCFRCEKNFNTIDLVMAVKELSFRESALFLRQILANSKCIGDAGQAVRTLAEGIDFSIPGSE